MKENRFKPSPAKVTMEVLAISALFCLCLAFISKFCWGALYNLQFAELSKECWVVLVSMTVMFLAIVSFFIKIIKQALRK